MENYSDFYIVGSGLAGLATAFYLIKEGSVPGKSITLLDGSDSIGGSLDAKADFANNQSFMRGFRMLEDKIYSASLDMMARLPSIHSPARTLYDEFIDFNRKFKTNCTARLVKDGMVLPARPLRMNFSDRLQLLKLLSIKESKIEDLPIEKFFSPNFFTSNFWFEFATTFSFQPWHSLGEMRRYILRFIQDSHLLDTQRCIRSTKYNQYDSIIRPLEIWLKEQGVRFLSNFSVSDVSFVQKGEKLYIKALESDQSEYNSHRHIEIGENKAVFITLGSMTDGYIAGSMENPPNRKADDSGSARRLWERISRISDQFGRPAVFFAQPEKSSWVSFTITFSDRTFFERLKTITHAMIGTEGPITLCDSNWLISFAIPVQPHFHGQPENLGILWGYGLYSAEPGNYVKKPMAECSGREILIELLRHLKFDDILEHIVSSSYCAPCFMPYITSQFMPRKIGDRPKVVPDCAGNFAFIGQYCEIPQDITFTLEYSVRSAQTAVHSLLKRGASPTPIYRGWFRIKHLFNAVRTIFR